MNKPINQIEIDFNAALSSYKSGKDLTALVQQFKTIINQIPNHFAAWTCLSWLNLLLQNNFDALSAARQAVKLNAQDPQARMNLALALLSTNTKGVREQIDIIKRMMFMLPEIEVELRESIEDGFKRYPNWQELDKVKRWLEL